MEFFHLLSSDLLGAKGSPNFCCCCCQGLLRAQGAGLRRKRRGGRETTARIPSGRGSRHVHCSCSKLRRARGRGSSGSGSRGRRRERSHQEQRGKRNGSLLFGLQRSARDGRGADRGIRRGRIADTTMFGGARTTGEVGEAIYRDSLDVPHRPSS